MPIHQLATDDAWRQTLERIGADIRWIGGRNDPWAPQYQRTGKYEGEAARDALRALNRMGEHQPYAQLHSWGPRPGKRDERGEVTIVNGLHQFEGWRIVGCMVEHPDTDRETWVFSLGTFRPPTRAGVVLIGAIEDRLVFPPERADYAKHRHPLLGVEFLGPVPNLDLTAPEGQDPPYREDEDKNSQAAQPQVIRRRTAGNRASGRRPRP